MRRVLLFTEDLGLEGFVKAVLQKLAAEHGIDVRIRPYSVTQGRGQMLTQLRGFFRDLSAGNARVPDCVVVATDANCKGLNQRQQDVESAVPDALKGLTVYAIPDPHVERWMLLDSAAFKDVFGKGCDAPDRKCEKDRFKVILHNAISAACGPPVGPVMGAASDVVAAMDLDSVARQDESLGRFVKAVSAKFRQWTQQAG